MSKKIKINSCARTANLLSTDAVICAEIASLCTSPEATESLSAERVLFELCRHGNRSAWVAAGCPGKRPSPKFQRDSLLRSHIVPALARGMSVAEAVAHVSQELSQGTQSRPYFVAGEHGAMGYGANTGAASGLTSLAGLRPTQD